MKVRFAIFTKTADRKLALLVALAVLPVALRAAIPPAENLLPADTLLVISTPDWTKTRETYGKSPYSQFLNDPAMKPFRDKFVAKWKEEFVTPLERDLGVKFDNYGELAQGQFTFAITQDGWEGGFDQIPAVLMLLDTKGKSGQLKTNLAELRKKWVDSGKTVKTETIRGVEFWIVPMSSNNVPRALQKFFPQRQEIHELGEETDKKPAPQDEIVIGQCQSLLIVGSSIRAAEKVVAHLTGGSVPALADEAAFDASKNALFRDAPLFAWCNAKRFFDVVLALPPAKPNPEAPSPFPSFDVGKIINATGLGGLKTVALAWRNLSEGSALDLYISAPESSRTGFLKILAPDGKDSNPPAFVPADVVKFQRWRLDGQKAVATLEKMAGEISPSALRVWNYLIKTGNDAAGESEAGFNLRQRLFGNLGDDIISYTKPPRDNSTAQLNSPPSLTLIGSANAEQMAAALKGLLVFVSPYITPKEREFLGRKIYTVTVTRPVIGASGAMGRELTYSASGGYLAITTDTPILEEFLRSSETPPKPLRELPGLADAAQMVGGQNTGLFSYENQAEKMRIAFQSLKASGIATNDSISFNPLPGLIPFAGPEKSMKGWLDFSLLPRFEKVAKYFSFAVYSGSANLDGIKFKFFTPTPPELRK
jgi:hypothetical protein